MSSSHSIQVLRANILDLNVEAIVNAANSEMSMGLSGCGGISGAIHKSFGSDALAREMIAAAIAKRSDSFLVTERNNQVFIDVGQAITTPTTNAPADSNLKKNNVKFIIHAVAPDCNDSNQFKARANLLRAAYVNAFEEAIKHNVKTIAVPALGSGIFKGNFSDKEMADITAKVILEYKERFSEIIVCGIDPMQLGTEPPILKEIRASLANLSIQNQGQTDPELQNPSIATKPNPDKDGIIKTSTTNPNATASTTSGKQRRIRIGTRGPIDSETSTIPAKPAEPLTTPPPAPKPQEPQPKLKGVTEKEEKTKDTSLTNNAAKTLNSSPEPQLNASHPAPITSNGNIVNSLKTATSKITKNALFASSDALQKLPTNDQIEVFTEQDSFIDQAVNQATENNTLFKQIGKSIVDKDGYTVSKYHHPDAIPDKTTGLYKEADCITYRIKEGYPRQEIYGSNVADAIVLTRPDTQRKFGAKATFTEENKHVEIGDVRNKTIRTYQQPVIGPHTEILSQNIGQNRTLLRT